MFEFKRVGDLLFRWKIFCKYNPLFSVANCNCNLNSILVLLIIILVLLTMAFNKLTKKELIIECQKRGLETEGLLKPALLKMLQDFESQLGADNASNAEANSTGAE